LLPIAFQEGKKKEINSLASLSGFFKERKKKGRKAKVFFSAPLKTSNKK